MEKKLSIIEVERFLTKCKIAVKSNAIFEFDEKDKETLAYLGFIYDDVEKEILSLLPVDYEDGPLPDEKGYAKDWWVFGKVIQGREVYIKLKVKDYNFEGEQQLSCLCISFHFAKYTLKFPYKK